MIVKSCPKKDGLVHPVDSDELGSASVGLVTGQEFKASTAPWARSVLRGSTQRRPHAQRDARPQARTTQPMRAITDWAYACDRMAGPGFFLVGDAAAFLDVLSTGVTMAMLAGYSASACLHTALSAPEREADVTTFYNSNYRRMWESPVTSTTSMQGIKPRARMTYSGTHVECSTSTITSGPSRRSLSSSTPSPEILTRRSTSRSTVPAVHGPA